MDMCVKEITSNKEKNIFYTDVINGLSQGQKKLLPKYFYDESGCKIYKEITELEEYYLTRTETRLLTDIENELTEQLTNVASIIEYGGGSGERTEILVKALDQLSHYVPIDVAEDQLCSTAESIGSVRPEIEVQPLLGSFEDLPTLSSELPGPHLGFLPGSTIGNFEYNEAKTFLRRIRKQLNNNAYLLMGYDLVKDPDVLVRAYDDKEAVTARFNLNLLARINRELDGNFDLNCFKHSAHFNSDKNRIEIHLVSTKDQVVKVADKEFSFSENESIHTENSHKYTLPSITGLLSGTQWNVASNWFDENKYYGMILLQAA